MEVAHHRRIGMRAQHAAQQVVRGANVGHPVAHGFVDGVLQRARARLHAAHLRAQQPHAEDVQLLPPHVLRAHVDHALHAEERAHGRGGHAVLTGAGLGDDAVLAHAPRQQRLPNAVVDLVRAGVQQVFALQVDLGAAELFAEPLSQEQRCGPAGDSRPAGGGTHRGRIFLFVPRHRQRQVPATLPSASRERSVRHRTRSGRGPRAEAWTQPAALWPARRLAIVEVLPWVSLPAKRFRASIGQTIRRSTQATPRGATLFDAELGGRSWDREIQGTETCVTPRKANVVKSPVRWLVPTTIVSRVPVSVTCWLRLLVGQAAADHWLA